MKNLKNLAALMMMALAITITACSKDQTIANGEILTGQVEVTPIGLTTVQARGDSCAIAVNALSGVTVTTDASWITIGEPTKLQTGLVYPIIVAPNTTNANRKATVTTVVNGVTYTTTVTQLASDGLLITSATDVNVAYSGETITVTVVSTGKFTTDSSEELITETIGASWITAVGDWTATSTSGSEMVTYTRSYTVAANPASSERTTTISYTLGSITEQVTVTQQANTGGDMSHTAMELAAMMYPGWNLGNTLEGGNSDNLWNNNGGLTAEISWQKTYTSQAIIDYVKAQGFKSVRIPCAWAMGHITDASACTIDEAWMARVKDVVDYCISAGLYVILNDHWDGGWLEDSFADTSDATIASNKDKLTKIWTQIANTFADYDEHLLFAGLNEPNNSNTSVFKTTASVNALYAYEQAFIDAVRATGGNNATRTLIVQGPATDIDLTNTYFDATKLTDTANSRLMVEVHFYSPWQFAGLESDASWGNVWYYWGSSNTGGSSDRTASSAYNESYVNKQMAKMKSKFADKGYPVIIGEYGANWRSGSGIDSDLHNASIKAYYKAVNQYAVSNGCVPFAWDTNYIGWPTMTIVNRATLGVHNQYMLDGINEGLSAATWPF